MLGTNPTGTWGVGARIKQLKLMEELSHVLRVNVFGGTNAAMHHHNRKAADNGSRTVFRNNTDFNSFGTYLTTTDTGLEVNFDTTWKPYDNLRLILEIGYIYLWLNDTVWGRFGNLPGDTLNAKDAWKVSLNFIYDF